MTTLNITELEQLKAEKVTPRIDALCKRLQCKLDTLSTRIAQLQNNPELSQKLAHLEQEYARVAARYNYYTNK